MSTLDVGSNSRTSDISLVVAIGIVVLAPAYSPPGTRAQATVVHWPLDGDGIDGSGGDHHGMVLGAVPTSDRDGNPSGALLSEGVDDDVNLGPSNELANDRLAVTAWIRVDSDVDNRVDCRALLSAAARDKTALEAEATHRFVLRLHA